MVSLMTIKLGNTIIYENNAFQLDNKKEMILSDYLLDRQLYPQDVPENQRTYPTHSNCVEIDVSFDFSKSNLAAKMVGHATVIGSDLTKEYVEVNADYRS